MPIRTIAVDLTPVLPDGENGGAKIFVLELIKRMAQMEPNYHFVLLTQYLSHGELAILESHNVKRNLVLGVSKNEPGAGILSYLKIVAQKILPIMPFRLRRVIGRIGYKFYDVVKRSEIHHTFLKQLGVDLLFCPFTAPTYFEAGIPTVCIIYDLQFKTYPEFFGPEDLAGREHTFRNACKRAAALTTISNYSREKVIEHSTIDPDRVKTIYLQMAQRIYSSDGVDDTVLKRLALTPEYYVLYPANFWQHKNHEVLLTAFGIARNLGLDPRIKLVCTGTPGERMVFLERAANSMGLQDKVIFPGYVSNADLSILMKNCKGVIFPSLYEGFGLPIIEAMGVGVPVACSNITSLPEVAAKAAILFDPRVPSDVAKAFMELVINESLRCTLRQNGLLRAVAFSDSTAMAKEYIDLFESILISEALIPQLAGVYSDSWTSSTFTIYLSPAIGSHTIDMTLFVPRCVHSKAVVIETFEDGKSLDQCCRISPGSSVVFQAKTHGHSRKIDFKIAPTFAPNFPDIGLDHRELGVIIKRLEICQTGSNLNSMQLWPEAT